MQREEESIANSVGRGKLAGGIRRRRIPVTLGAIIAILVVICSTLAFSQQWHEFQANTPAKAKHINENFDIVAPTGAIIMWSGAVDSIPSGWLVCNGQNGTPDLRNRFVVGAGSTYSPNDTGGVTSVTLDTTQIPGHSHPITDPGHDHGYSKTENPGNYGFCSCWGTANVYVNSTESTGTSLTSIAVGNNTGGGGAHENRPPYYALAFIMRVQ